MISSTEDELLASVTWLDDSYTLSEFIDEFPLPQVVRVVRGHDGGTDVTTLGYGEVLTIHALQETRVLVAEDKNGDPLSIGLDFPDEFQILPQTKDCNLVSCEVADFASFYPTVRFLEVIQAHYGTGEDIDSAAQGEILEILDISKANRRDKSKVHVRNVENDQKSVLTATCSARFRPLLDWRKYKAPELKTHQFGFPVRVRFMDRGAGSDNTEYQSLITKNPDVNIVSEARDVIIVTTSVSSEAEYKFCFEVPKDLEVKVAVADGFSTGARHYTDVVTILNQRFDVTKFLTCHQPPLIKRRDAIRRYDYDSIKQFIIDKSMPFPNESVDDETDEAPPLPPRPKPVVKKTQSLDIQSTTPPSVLLRKSSEPSTETSKPPKPAVTPRSRSASQNQEDSVISTPRGDDNTSISISQDADNIPSDLSQNEVNNSGKRKFKRPVSIPNTTSNIPARTPNNFDDPAERMDNVPVQLPKPSPNLPQSTISAPIDLQAELKARIQGKRPVKVPRTIPPPAPPKDVVEDPTLAESSSVTPPSEADEKENKPQPAPITSPKLPPRRTKPAVSDSKSQGAKSVTIDSYVQEIEAPLDTNGQSPNHSPARPQDETDACGVTENPTNQTASSEPAGQKEDVSSLKQAKSPKLPPRHWRPIVENLPEDSQGGHSQPLAEKSQTEDIAKPDETADTYAPKLPPKSPGRRRKVDSHYVQPIPPHDPNYQAQQPDRPLQRAVTLPKNYRPGVSYTQRDEGLYEVPFAPPIASVTPLSPGKPGTTPENPYDLIATVPLELSGLSVTDVSNILKNLNMAQYAERFESELIDGDLLKQLSKPDLETFNMESLHCTKLLRFIQGWRPQLSTKLKQ